MTETSAEPNAHVLDRPVWSALTTKQADLAEGNAHARRFPPAVIPFGAARDGDIESHRALLAMLAPGQSMVMAEAGPLLMPDTPYRVETGDLVQMVLARAPAAANDPRIAPLSAADAQDMFDLAMLTRPGPFTLGAQRLGGFFGIRNEGRLVAMAGVRMHQIGYTEISGVCTHPHHRGQGMARTLTLFMAQRILKTGNTPYIHALAGNHAAIALYASLGFNHRKDLNMARIQRPA